MKILILISLSTVILVACQSQPTDVTDEKVTVDGSSYTCITPDELNAMLQNKDFAFINVHIPFAGNIANTDLSIPYDQISSPEKLTQLPVDKNSKIVLYCRSGRMSAIATEELVSLGYTNVWNLDGGMDAWIQAGYKLEK